MKKLSIMSLVLCLILGAASCYTKRIITYQTQSPRSSDDIYDQSSGGDVSYEVFYDELAPYGSWIDYPEYGYVWIPRVSVDFHPYATQGHWVMTNYGWTWVSDFRWGWAAFHYGRWAFEPRFGWMWLPGRVWGPAWVAWRESPDYFGWAPLGPFVDISINISCPFDHYRFVPRRYFAHRNIYNYYADRRNHVTIINNTTIINTTHVVNKNNYYYGPRKDFVETAVGQKIRTANVYDNKKPDATVVENDRVIVYRPRIDNVPVDGRKSAPKRVVPTSELQPIPADRELTPTVKRTKPQITEGGDVRPIDKQPQRGDVPQKKPDVIQPPRREDILQKKPDVIQPPRREDIPQNKPDVIQPPKRGDVPKNKPDVIQPPKRGDVPKAKPEVKKQPRKNDAPKEKETKKKNDNETTPPKKRNGSNNS
jgi:hypothetical protein